MKTRCCHMNYRRAVTGATRVSSLSPPTAPFAPVCKTAAVLAMVTAGVDWCFSTLPRVVTSCGASFRVRCLAMNRYAISQNSSSLSTWPNTYYGLNSRSLLRNPSYSPQNAKCANRQAFYVKCIQSHGIYIRRRED